MACLPATPGALFNCCQIGTLYPRATLHPMDFTVLCADLGVAMQLNMHVSPLLFSITLGGITVHWHGLSQRDNPW